MPPDPLPRSLFEFSPFHRGMTVITGVLAYKQFALACKLGGARAEVAP